MKIVFVLLLIIALLACRCLGSHECPARPVRTGAATIAAPVTPTGATPDLTGSWTGPMQGYDEGTGFSDYAGFKAVMNVSGQHGRIFAGRIVFTANGTETSTGFAGVIGRDGRTLSIAEKDGGYCTGEIVGPDEIDLTYLQDGSPYSVAIDTWKRV
jgi:hypothetical protein